MEPQQAVFDTYGRWLATRLHADLAAILQTPTPPLYAFFTFLYQDMLAHPEVYAIPHEPFTPFFARAKMTPEETAQHEALKAAKMRVRKVALAYLEFLFTLGRSSRPTESGNLSLPRPEFEKLSAEAAKKTRNPRFLAALDGCGLVASSGDPLEVTNSRFPGMPAELARFAQACANVKNFDFYLFRRADLAVFDGKTAPDFADALQLCPQPFRDAVAETDARLREMRFKREIFVDGGDLTYRLRYSRKGDLVVYWCRILETFEPDLHHYLRWKLNSELTPRLFTRLEDLSPGLAERVFDDLKPCAHCYPNCLDRVTVEWAGEVKEACNGQGWNQIGTTRADYERLWLVAGALNQLVGK